MCLIASNCQDARPCLAVDGPSALRHHGWDGGASRAATRTSSASAVSSWSARAHGALTAFLVHCRMPCVSSGLEVPNRRAAARMRIPSLWNFSVNGSTPPWIAHLQAHAASSHCLEPRCCLIHHDIDSSDRCALALQVFSIFDSAGAGDAEHIDEKLSTSCARWAAVCMRAVCSKRAWSAMQNLLPLCVSGCTHRIRAPPGHGYDVLCVACAFACVFMIPMRKIYQKLGGVRSNHKTMILRPWSVWSTYISYSASSGSALWLCESATASHFYLDINYYIYQRVRRYRLLVFMMHS